MRHEVFYYVRTKRVIGNSCVWIGWNAGEPVVDIRKAKIFSDATSRALMEAGEFFRYRVERVNRVIQFHVPSGAIRRGRSKLRADRSPGMMYYLQDTRSDCGKSAMWWVHQASGYSCDIRKAMVFSREEIERDRRGTDVPWPVPYINSKIECHIDIQDLSTRYGEWRPMSHTLSSWKFPEGVRHG